jgi:hypothetical protein
VVRFLAWVERHGHPLAVLLASALKLLNQQEMERRKAVEDSLENAKHRSWGAIFRK